MSFSDIVTVLDRGDGVPEIMDSLLVKRVEVVRSMLVCALGSRTNISQRSQFIDTFDMLTERYKVRFLISSELMELLQLGRGFESDINPALDGVTDDAWYRLLWDCLAREALFCGIDSGTTQVAYNGKLDRVWSPVGDVYAERQDGSWSMYKAPSIDGLIAIDFDSNLSRRTELRSGVLSQPYVPMTPTARRKYASKIENALNLIDTAIPLYGALIRNFTRRILVRRSNQKYRLPNKISSEHVPRQPGVIRFLNFHSDVHSVSSCAEQLLHESLHNFIACWETVNGRLFEADDYLRPVSPWSGNPIPNSSLAHAIFVYYGIYQFYSALGRTSDVHLDSEQRQCVQNRLIASASGFMSCHSLMRQFVCRRSPPGAFADAVDSIQSRVRSAHGVIEGVA